MFEQNKQKEEIGQRKRRLVKATMTRQLPAILGYIPRY
jgi:hypothetical protein